MNRAKIFIAFTFLLAFAVCVSAQSVQFPNELKGYEFYDQGKLKDLRLKTSTSEDVKAIFGNDCILGGCDYNKDWEVGFFYYFDGMKRYKTENDVRKTYVVSPQYVGRIYSILLIPRKPISLDRTLFSKEFEAKDTIGEHGVELKYFTDSRGLYYTLYYNDSQGKGNLRYIEYNHPESLTEEGFILIQIEDKLSSDF